jgi:hypothetical protein
MALDDPLLATLAAGGPHPDHADQLMLFGRFVGVWDIRSVRHDPVRGALPEQSLEWTFGWVLEGRAIQDVLRGEGGIGTTVRVLHPQTGTWTVTWQSTAQDHAFSLVARPAGDRILIQGTGPDGGLEEWSFDEIAEDAFTWRSRVSTDGGASWFTDQEMRARRRR